jgi:hypothetical protein
MANEDKTRAESMLTVRISIEYDVAFLSGRRGKDLDQAR